MHIAFVCFFEIIEYEIDLIIGPIMIIVITLIAVLLDRKQKIVKL